MLIKGTLRGLRQFLATENPLRIMKNAFYFTLKAVSIINTFKFCSEFFDDVEKPFDKKTEVNFKLYDVTKWETNNYSIHIAPHLKK